jgi:hypothetical protein
MCFGLKRSNHIPNIIYNTINLEQVDSFEYLGYKLDNRLNFSEEVAKIITKLNKCTAILARCRPFLDTRALFNIFNCLALSYINYSHPFISNANTCVRNKITRCYNNVGAVMYHCSPKALALQNWIPLDCRLYLANLVFIHRIIRNNCCHSLCSVFVSRKRPYNTRSTFTYEHIRCNTKCMERSFEFWAPRLWDALPENMKNIGNSDTFSRHLKTLVYE